MALSKEQLERIKQLTAQKLQLMKQNDPIRQQKLADMSAAYKENLAKAQQYARRGEIIGEAIKPASLIQSSKKVGKAVGGFIVDIPRYVARGALSVGLDSPLGRGYEQNDGKRILDPKEFGVDKINIGGKSFNLLGSQPIESTGTRALRYENYLQDKGIKGATPLAVAGSTGITALDLFFGSGKKAKTAVNTISKLKDTSKIYKEIRSTFKVSDDLAKEIAPKLAKETDKARIGNVLKSTEVISKIEKDLGIKTPANLRAEISKNIDSFSRLPQKSFNESVTKMTDDIISSHPSKIKPTIDELKTLAEYTTYAAEKGRKTPYKKLKMDELESEASKLANKFGIEDTGSRKTFSYKIGEFLEKNNFQKVIKEDEALQTKLKQMAEEEEARELAFERSSEFQMKNADVLLRESAKKQKAKAIDSMRGEIGSPTFESPTEPIESLNKKPPEEAFGAVGGFELDEDGKVRFNPKKAAVSVAGISAGKNLGKKINISKLPKHYQDVAKIGGANKRKASELMGSITRGISKALAPISTRLEKIAPELKNSLRKFEYGLNTNVLKDTNTAIPFLKATRKMDKTDLAIFDLAAKNGDMKVMNALAESYGFKAELQAVRNTLDDLYKRAKEVGADIGYSENYFPRTIKDPKGFLEYLGKGDDWSIIQDALKLRAEKLGKRITDLDIEEKAQIINNLLRGYGDKISLAKIKNFKSRKIDVLDTNLNQFYEPFESSLVNYVQNANEYIEARKYFGKGLPKDVDIQDSIAHYVINLITEGKIKPSQEKELTDILRARFSKKKVNSAIRVYKNLEYIDTMGSPISALTQIGDLAFSAYKAGYYRTGKSLLGAVFKRSKFTREDLGIERIAQEFIDGSKTGKAVDKIFKATGLNWIDRLGKETLINASYSKYVKLAKKKDKVFGEKLLKMFSPDEARQVVSDFKNGRKTENVKYVLFNDLLDMQPVALSEMPEKYLSAPNGRIFYMLKTYQLKVLDIYRREIFSDMKKHPLTATKNLIKLAGALMVFNITADKIKDFVLGRETDFNDTMVDNILRTAGFSKYDVWKAREEGIATSLKKKILPPSKIFDSIYKDIVSDSDKKSELPQSVPLVGKLYYWWFGRGAEKTKKTTSRSTKRVSRPTPKKRSKPTRPNQSSSR